MTVILIMIIGRPAETKRIEELKKWILIYGRRKTGKTFIARNFVKHDEYFFVKLDRAILTKNNESISYETFIEILKRSLEQNKTVIVDEFHRLEDSFFDFLHFTKKQGKLILISSTLFLSKRLISDKSALLGLFAEAPVGLISLTDTLTALKKIKMEKKEKLELAIFLEEPLAIDYFDEKKSARENIITIFLSSLRTIPALTGEIFLEEERGLSAVYEGVLRAVAVGKTRSGEISSYLFSKKLIKKDDPSLIQQYLNNLLSFGIIRRLEIFNKKKFAYKLVSPLARLYYYSDEKYNLSERKISEKELLRIIDELMPKIVEDTVREFLSDKNGLSETLVEMEGFEIDGCLLRFKKPEIALEVKWGAVTKGDIKKTEANLQKINAKKRVLFVQDKGAVSSKILKIMDVSDLLL